MAQKSSIDLLAELDAEFGKKPKGKKALEKSLEGKGITQRSSTGTFSEIAAAANAVSASWKNQPGWRAVRRLTYIVAEFCDHCSGRVDYIGNVFTVFENKRLRSTISAPELVTHDEFGFELPHMIEEHIHNVPYCASCLRLSRRIEDYLAAVFINGVPKQLDLTFNSEKTPT